MIAMTLTSFTSSTKKAEGGHMMSKIALYIRLSVEDQVKETESESIISQRMLLNEYLDNKEDLKHFERFEYVDDGYSGTNENRPAYQRLLEDIKSGKVKNIIVKDMSRFLRDYLSLGDYLENIFPFLGVRFIAINDSYDSDQEKGNGTDLDIQFKTLMYDFYSKDASVKTKTVRDTLNRQGKVQAWAAPYGYRKDPNDKYKYLIDEKVAWVVRKIFDLALEGLSMSRIAQYLNEQKIEVPAKRKLELTEMDYKAKYLNTELIWTNKTVTDILDNENYTGVYLFNKYEHSVFIGRKTRVRSRDQWERVYDHHEPIVSEEEFQKVQEIKKSRSLLKGKKNTDFPWRKHSPLQGFARCPKCNHILACNRSIRKRKNKPDIVYRYFRCRICKMKGEKRQGSNADIVEPIVYQAIIERFGKESNTCQSEKPAVDYDDRLKNIEITKQSLYEKYKLGKITRLDFIEKKERLDQEA